MAAVPPPVPLAGTVAGTPPVTAPITTFFDRYSDQRFDNDNNNYTQLLAEFDPMSPTAPTAPQLLEALLAEADDTSRALLVMWQDITVPTSPGQAVVLHGIKRYARPLGVPTTAWDDKIYSAGFKT